MALKVLILLLATMVILTLTLNLKNNGEMASKELTMVRLPKRASRFLIEQQKTTTNPRASDHCKKDNEICYALEGGNSTCCNNKCMDLSTDMNNCGACKNKCKYTDTCCSGQCVNMANNQTHCGVCGNKCMPSAYCFKGMCDYA